MFVSGRIVSTVQPLECVLLKEGELRLLGKLLYHLKVKSKSRGQPFPCPFISLLVDILFRSENRCVPNMIGPHTLLRNDNDRGTSDQSRHRKGHWSIGELLHLRRGSSRGSVAFVAERNYDRVAVSVGWILSKVAFARNEVDRIAIVFWAWMTKVLVFNFLFHFLA